MYLIARRDALGRGRRDLGDSVGVARVGKKTGRWFDSMTKAAPEPLKKVYFFKVLRYFIRYFSL
jgi:hypothetical protein